MKEEREKKLMIRGTREREKKKGENDEYMVDKELGNGERGKKPRMNMRIGNENWERGEGRKRER